jgi:type II secretory pathway pseudopilin PulG
MLVALWITAIATAILAISGPVALAVWITSRRADRERRQRERDEQAAERILRNARDELKSATDELVPKSWLAGITIVAVIGTLIGWSSWTERKEAARSWWRR